MTQKCDIKIKREHVTKTTARNANGRISDVLRETDLSVKVSKFISRLADSSTQSLALLLGVQRLHVLTRGASSKLLNLQHQQQRHEQHQRRETTSSFAASANRQRSSAHSLPAVQCIT